MSFRKFEKNDIILNTMKASPQCEFLVHDATVFYNNVPEQSGTTAPSTTPPWYIAAANVRNVSPGWVSLYEYNINRLYMPTDKVIGNTASYSDAGSDDQVYYVRYTNQIYPWISKDSARSAFRTVGVMNDVGTTNYNVDAYGKVIGGSYPLSSSIEREYITAPSASLNKHYWSLRTRLDFYSIRSEHYKISSSFGNKDTQTLNLISIPSIFYGSQIKPGSLSLKLYVTGTFVAELQDTKQNGELIQVTGSTFATAQGSSSVAGVAMYDEGFLILTGAWNLNGDTYAQGSDGAGGRISGVPPRWIYFAGGAYDGTAAADNSDDLTYTISFKGTTETQVMTMFAKAGRGKVNYSNNPTFLEYGQDPLQFTSSHVYEENSSRNIANIVSSSYTNYSASFQRQVYISKVGVYDENKNLIGVATLANPVLKKEDEDLAIKIKLDI
jgi:hypothetical protein